MDGEPSSIRGSKIFAVIADESRDCSNKEQMPLIVMYVDKHSSIVGAFLAFVECEYCTSGEQLATLIELSCQSIGLDMSLCPGQGYDGAGNMAGLCTRAAKRIRDKYPKAFYFHCTAHRLNLCVAHALKSTSVSNMFSVITSTAIIPLTTEITGDSCMLQSIHQIHLRPSCFLCAGPDGWRESML